MCKEEQPQKTEDIEANKKNKELEEKTAKQIQSEQTIKDEDSPEKKIIKIKNVKY